MNLSVTSNGDSQKETIVFLHGLGVSSWMWTQQVEALQAEYHCLTIDLPGNGESYQVPWHSFADTAAQVAGIIRERASGGQAHLLTLVAGQRGGRQQSRRPLSLAAVAPGRGDCAAHAAPHTPPTPLIPNASAKGCRSSLHRQRRSGLTHRHDQIFPNGFPEVVSNP